MFKDPNLAEKLTNLAESQQKKLNSAKFMEFVFPSLMLPSCSLQGQPFSESWNGTRCYRALYSLAALSNLPRPSSSLPSPSWSIGENNPISQINLSCSPQSWGNGIPLVYCGYCHLLPGDNQSGQQVGTIETRANNAQTNGPHNPKYCQLMIQTLAKSWRPVCSCLL